jgi:hypothetical protein
MMHITKWLCQNCGKDVHERHPWYAWECEHCQTSKKPLRMSITLDLRVELSNPDRVEGPEREEWTGFPGYDQYAY